MDGKYIILSPTLSLRKITRRTFKYTEMAYAQYSHSLHVANFLLSLSYMYFRYHAEMDCNYDNNGQTYKNIGYCESHDGGLTFTKPKYVFICIG